MQYSSAVYSKLTSSDDMHGVAEAHIPELLALGQVICDHNLQKCIGVTLAHRHHNLSESERLVWSIMKLEWLAKPVQVPDRDLAPINWKVEGHEGSTSAWYSLEFCPRDKKYSPESEQALQVAESQKFLDEFRGLVINLKVQDIFGLGLLQSRRTFNRSGMTMFERSDLSKRITKAWLVPEQMVGDFSSGVTLWNFKTKGISTPRRCAYGNSRHCCG